MTFSAMVDGMEPSQVKYMTDKIPMKRFTDLFDNALDRHSDAERSKKSHLPLPSM